MPTFLTTSRMAPALAARIEASVRGHRAGPKRDLGPTVVGLARLLLLAAVVGIVAWIIVAHRREMEAMERDRAALLDDLRQKSASLTPADRASVSRAETALLRAAAPYEGDFVSPELRAPGAFAAALARPLMYVRGPVDAFAERGAIAATAATSAKDALLLCLLEPPSGRARDEKTLLAKVHVAYAGGAPMEQATPSARRLHDAEAGLPFLLPPWAERVQRAPDPTALERLRRDLERAPLDAAKLAAKAGLLLFAMDEAGIGGGPTELDGERPHGVRVGLVDLASSTLLLRVRRGVDPAWISVAKRPDYATGLDACRLALDVHDAVSAPPAAASGK